MVLTSNTLTGASVGQERPEALVIDLSQSLPTLLASLNLLPQNAPYPDIETLFKMTLDAMSSKISPAPQVLRETIFVNLLVTGLQVVENLNHFNLWTEAGYAMYKFDHFLNDNTVVLARTRTFSY
mgnify:CR=1 FL=1